MGADLIGQRNSKIFYFNVTRSNILQCLSGDTHIAADVYWEENKGPGSGLTFGHGLSFYRTGVVKFTLISSPILLKHPATACVRTRILASCIA